MRTSSSFAMTSPVALAVFGSVAAHAAVALFAVQIRLSPQLAPRKLAEVEVEMEAPPGPPLDAEEGPHESTPGTQPPDRAIPQPSAPRASHASPPSPERPAGESSLAAAPSALTTPDPAPARFSIVLGQAATSVGGVAGAAGAGDGSGAAQGSGGGQAASKSAEPGEGPMPESKVSERADIVSALRPEYPPGARARAIEATVSLEIVVDRDGSVAEARVIRGAGYGFDESAIRALKAARFSPARRSGRTVRVRMQWTVDFKLE